MNMMASVLLLSPASLLLLTLCALIFYPGSTPLRRWTLGQAPGQDLPPEPAVPNTMMSGQTHEPGQAKRSPFWDTYHIYKK